MAALLGITLSNSSTVFAATGAAEARVTTAPGACAAGTTVETASGMVCGTSRDGSPEWLGLPFAAAPVGNLRWAAPRGIGRWTDVRQATAFGSPCVQGDGTGAEDCLFLNITAPRSSTAASRKNLPVVVQLHPGGFISGSGNADYRRLADTGTIVVSINYRLGALGFLAAPLLGKDPGDYGLLDQQAALRWVQRNIAMFGGDRRRVTLMGESAGGSSVCHQLVSPSSAGLFQRAISYSGYYNPVTGSATGTAFPLQLETQDCKSDLPSAAQAQQKGTDFARAAGCDTGACLREMSVAAVLKTAGSGFQYAGGHGTTAPTLNRNILPTTFVAGIRNGSVHRVPVMIGVARDENLTGAPTTGAAYRNLVQAQYGAAADAVLKTYRLDHFASPFLAWRTVTADSNTICPALRVNQSLAQRSPTYAFIMDDPDATPAAFVPAGMPGGSYHVADWFLFSEAGLPTATTANEQVLQQQELGAVSSFARTGDPNSNGIPAWPQLRSNGNLLSLQPGGDSEAVSTSALTAIHNCAFWNGI
ncbi:carboxylesterase/lipase family protein [Actinoplanes sp. M2I2]|uniref:carboxylesterase/lipase family protein n=1 Tax=Actinoplanes sp. M2I2 TaxID=1734444 RepID=UPI002021CA77|nr:carboxylesterase family protein [Actinoplanes sp. M2I2]